MPDESLEPETKNIKNRRRRQKTVFTVIREWLSPRMSNLWSLVASSFSIGSRQRTSSPETSAESPKRSLSPETPVKSRQRSSTSPETDTGGRPTTFSLTEIGVSTISILSFQERNSNYSKQKSRKSKTKSIKSGKLSITSSIVDKEHDLKRKRKYMSHVLVLGLSGSGKSRMIEELLSQDLQKSPQENPFITEIETERLTIIEGPGFCPDAGFETDATSIAIIKRYLTQKLPNQIPNAIIIVGRLGDNRFEGEGSDFSRMLNGIRCLCRFVADTGLTNVILVLTYKDGEKIEDVDFRLSRFLITFESTFPQCTNIRVLILGKNGSMRGEASTLLNALYNIGSARQDVDFMESLKLFGNSDSTRSYQVAMIRASEFGPLQKDIYKIMKELEVIKILEPYLEYDSTEDSGSDAELVEKREQGKNDFFHVVKTYSKVESFIKSDLVFETWLRKGTLVKMADGSDMAIDDIRVGDRLLNYNLKPDVVLSVSITTLSKWKEDQRLPVVPIARTKAELFPAHIYCCYPEYKDDGRVLQFNRGRIRLMPYIDPIGPVTDEETLYCIRMNRLNGTYIGDNWVFKHRIPSYPETSHL